MKKFISWRRVSTQKQGSSGLGLEAQKEIINYFVKAESGVLINDFCEVYTGKDLAGCTELRKAIQATKETEATLIIAKSDRFRNTMEALQVLNEVGERNIFFCDLPHTDKFTLTLFFALAEREALITSIRTKQALNAKKERKEETGGTNNLWGSRNGNTDRAQATKKAAAVSSSVRREKALKNENNRLFFEFITDWQAIHGVINWQTNWQAISDELNKRGKKTATGLPFDKKRAQATYVKLLKLYGND